MKIYLDFDRTLFDTDSFLNELYKIIKKYKIPISVFKKHKDKLKREGFNIKDILLSIEKEYSLDQEIFNAIDNLIKKDAIYIYSDVIKFLETLKERDYEIILLTRGNKDFQEEKINSSTLLDYFNQVIVTMKHKGDLDIDYNGIFIDDNLKELESISKRNPLKIICINRGESRLHPKFLTVTNLNEAYEYLNNEI